MKCQQVGLLHGPLGDDGVDDIAPRLLVIQSIVLDVPDEMLCLLALHQISDNSASQKWILAHIFKCASISGLSGEIHPAPKGHIEALRPQFASYQFSILTSRFRVPARCRSEVGRHRRRISSVGSAIPHTIACVGNEQRRDAKTLYAFGITCAAVCKMCQGHLPLGGMCHAIAM